MGLIVADASVGVAWLHPRQATPETDVLLKQVGSSVSLLVPVLWAIEVYNGLLGLMRSRRMSREDYFRALSTFRRMPHGIDSEMSTTALDAVSRLALEHGLSAYDATYLELAIRMGLPLASKDGPQRKAAIKCCVELCF